jgi:hypothetical protein
MSEKVSLSSEEKDLLHSIVRKRLPSFLWSVSAMNEKPLNAAQRDTVKSLLMDEIREAGGPTTDRGGAIKKLIARFASV